MSNNVIAQGRLRASFLDDPRIIYRTDPLDTSHVIVSSQKTGKHDEVIGHIYIQESEQGTIYHCTNREGSTLCQSSTDFIMVEHQFEVYNRMLMTERELKLLNGQSVINNFNLNNLNQMKNSNQNQTKSKKVNQIIFVEYQHPTDDGHLITVTDSYRNTLGRINREYNAETKKYEFTAYDHTGKAVSEKSEKLWELKKMFTDNSKQLLEDAHQRRIESKEKNQSEVGDKDNREQEPGERPARRATSKDTSQVKTGQKESERSQANDLDEPELSDDELQQMREDELQQLREGESEREIDGLDR